MLPRTCHFVRPPVALIFHLLADRHLLNSGTIKRVRGAARKRLNMTGMTWESLIISLYDIRLCVSANPGVPTGYNRVVGYFFNGVTCPLPPSYAHAAYPK